MEKEGGREMGNEREPVSDRERQDHTPALPIHNERNRQELKRAKNRENQRVTARD